MASPSTRYRLTVTPIEKDGMHCSGRCTIEVEHRARQDWMRLLENAPRLAGFSGDERAAVLRSCAMWWHVTTMIPAIQ